MHHVWKCQTIQPEIIIIKSDNNVNLHIQLCYHDFEQKLFVLQTKHILTHQSVYKHTLLAKIRKMHVNETPSIKVNNFFMCDQGLV